MTTVYGLFHKYEHEESTMISLHKTFLGAQQEFESLEDIEYEPTSLTNVWDNGLGDKYFIMEIELEE